MYKVYCDDYLLYDNNLESLKIFSPKLSLELNVVPSFTFTIYPEHPYFAKLQKMKSIVKVLQNDEVIFSGRILNDVNGVYNEKKVTCEGDLSFLLDSIQRPYEFQGTPSELFTQLIQNHNSQVDSDHQFKVGTITVTDPNDYINRADSTYMNTFESINKKLIEGLGGYLRIRYEDDGSYIDYLQEFNLLSEQTIEVSKNLIDIKRTIKADDIFTVLIPLGATNDDTGEVLTIASVNDGNDYLENTEAIQKYGRIVKVQKWDDVTLASNLKTKAQKVLDAAEYLMNSIQIKAVDLNAIDKDINSFHLGTSVHVISEEHGIDKYFMVQKLSLDLLNPTNNKLSLDSKYGSLTEQQTSIKHMTTQINNRVDSVSRDVTGAINTTKEQFESSLQSTSDSIMSQVSESYYLKGETDELISSVQTSLEQTSSGFEMKFEELNKDINDVISGTDAQFENISKYIRFVDGSIILGEAENELELKISNDRIQFVQNNSEVAYFSNNKLFVVDADFTNSLQLGKFAFLPRSTGNLSFKKVVE